MRADSFGFYWADAPVVRGRNSYPLHLASIPETGWTAPREFPNLRNAKLLSLDCETKDPNLREMGPGFRRKDAHICGISVGVETGERWYFPMRHEVSPEENLDPDAVLAWARDNLCVPGQAKVGANLGYDVDALWSEGVHVTGPFYDVQYAEALLDENKRSYSLENIAQQYLSEGKVGDVLKKWAEKSYGDHEPYRANIYRSPPNLVGPYAEGDADLPLRIFAMQRRELAAQGLTDLFEMESELLPQIIRMRQRGVRVDIEGAKLLDDQLSAGILDFDSQLKSLAGRVVDVNSAIDLAKVFDAAGVQYGTTATGKPSFTKLFLEQCSHPIAQMIVERRKLEKYQSTFIRGYILGLSVEGRIHALFHPLKGDENGTVSGRFSSSLPNLTNIPARDPIWGPRIRGLFLPEIGEDWGRHDYSQIEYRFLAHYAQGPSARVVQELYRKNPDTDFHIMTQNLIHEVAGVLLDRKPVKNVNFGLCYGMGKPKLINNLGITAQQGEELFDAYHKGVPFVKATYQSVQDRANSVGYIRTVLNRRARFTLWEPANGAQQGPALPEKAAIAKYGRVRRAFTHKALNRLLQGSAADLLKKAMVEIGRSGVESVLGPLLLTCHDETGNSVPRTAAGKQALDEVRNIMQSCLQLKVPVLADQSTGENWGACK